MNFNIAGLDGDLNAFQNVLAAAAADDKPGFSVAPHLMIFQEVQNADTSLPTVATSPLTTRINAAFPGVTYVRGTYTTSSGEDSASGAQCVYYRSDTLTEIGHIDINNTGGGRNTDRWQFRLNGYTASAATFYVYSSHLKASLGFEPERDAGVALIRANADALPAGAHIIYAGDYNMYTSAEPAYQRLVSAGNGQANDPYGNVDWTGGVNAYKHTQSPCNSGCVLVGGGMDDRFDIQLATNAFVDGEGLSRIANAYRPFGNDGNHYNLDINSGNNTYYSADIPRSNALATILKVASDHIPVICEYQAPAKMGGSLPASFGRVIQGATATVSLQVSNTASALVPSGADELDFSATGSGAVVGTASGVVNALAAPATRNFSIDTGVVGPRSGSIALTSSSQAVEPASLNLATSGSVVRHANASLSSTSDRDSDSLFRIFVANTGVQPFADFAVYNFGYDANQALLDVDGVSGAASPLQFAGGLAGNIGAGSTTLHFSVDTTTAANALASAAVSVQVSDEDIPGAAGDVLSLTLEARVRLILGDVTNDCLVDLVDVTTLLAAFGACVGDAQYNRECDLDNSGCIDLADLTTFLGDFGRICP